MSEALEELRERVAALEALLAGETAVEHLVAQRVDVVEPDGSLRLVLTSSERSPSTSVAGEEVGVPGQRPGLLFFNERGDECGGLTYGGSATDEGVTAGAVVALDRFSNDQIVALFYDEGAHGHAAGLRVVDRPEMPLPVAMRRAAEIDAMADGPDKEQARSSFFESGDAPFGSNRVFLGLAPSGSAVLQLCDAQSRPRIVFRVAKDGTPSIQVLDETGALEREL